MDSETAPAEQAPLTAERFGLILDRNFPVQHSLVERVQIGLHKMRSSRVAICGLARDVGHILPTLIPQVTALLECFREGTVVVYENDSHDNTVDLLQAESFEDDRWHTMCHKLGQHRFPSKRSVARSCGLASCRNVYREYVLSHFSEFDYVIVLDFDTLAFSLPGVCRTFAESDWDACASFGLQAEPSWTSPTGFANFDVWAWRSLKHPEPHKPGDPAVRGYRIHRGAPLIPVLSAFGGMAVYTMDAFSVSAYRGGDCEHALFHEDQRRRGLGRFYVSPDQLTAVR
jgi:hypothetical protein